MAHDSATLLQVAVLHAEGLDRGFLSRLGPRFLTLLYAAIDAGPDSVLLVEKRDGRVAGFVAGGNCRRQIYRRLLCRPVAVALALAPHLVRPSKLRGMWELVRLHGADGSERNVTHPLPEHELFSIVVAPAVRGTGLAEALYRGLEEHFRAAGIPAFKIIVGEMLTPAHRFYRRMGAQPISKLCMHGQSTSTVYLQELDQSQRRRVAELK